jgi:hypothetical protein
MPHILSVAQFFDEVTFVPDTVKIDEDMVQFILHQACRVEKFDSLKIPHEFFSFLQSKSYLLSFFDEMSKERGSFDTLLEYDIYEEYKEHIIILKSVYCEYLRLLEKYNFCDSIRLSNEYQINSEFLSNYNEIEFNVGGYLSKFELEVLDSVSKHTNLVLNINLSSYSNKLIERFKEYGIALGGNAFYRVDFSKKEIIDAKLQKADIKSCQLYEAVDKISQVAYIKKRVNDYINEGINPEDIVVILPDESFLDILELFLENEFNYAMGFSFEREWIYKDLEAVLLFFEQNERYAERYIKRRELNKSAIYRFFEKSINSDNEFFDALQEIGNGCKEDIKEHYLDSVYRFKLYFKEIGFLTHIQKLKLFLQRLKKLRVDSVGGGKVTVMGVLECRDLEYEGVIIADFSEEFVPKKSQKDIFLNSFLKSKCDLPTPHDREELQKHYYYQIISNSKLCSISYVRDEKSSYSKILDDCGIEIKRVEYLQESVNKLLFKIANSTILDEDIIQDFDFQSFEFSFTSLNDLHECKRRFYYKYILGLDSRDDEEELMGTTLHEVLHKVFEKAKKLSFFDEDMLYKEAVTFLQSCKSDSLVRGFEIDSWILKLKRFFEVEKRRYELGYRVKELEIFVKNRYADYKIKGKIDRIDTRDSVDSVIDYKSGKNVNTNSFQLAFYYLLLKGLNYNAQNFEFYDLQLATLKSDNKIDEKLKLIDDIFNSLKSESCNFSKCEDIKSCLYCKYKIICQRV